MNDQAPLADAHLYRPLFSPWHGGGRFQEYLHAIRGRTLVSPDRCWILYSLARQALGLRGEVWECGVYRAGTARLLAEVMADHGVTSGRCLRLFDTFEGMPDTDPGKDRHVKGDFANTSLGDVAAFVGHPECVRLHPGFIPTTFRGLESAEVCFAHVDVDIHQSVVDCCAFIYPRLVTGGVMVFDDYGFPTCPGARSAVDAFFAGTPCVPLVLPTGQAIVFKSF